MSGKLYVKSTQELMMDYFKEINLLKGQEFKKLDIIKWFNKKYPKIKNGTINCHLLKLSVNSPSRKHFGVREDGKDDVLWQINAKTFRLYDKISDIFNNGENGLEEMIDEGNFSLFAYEKDLQNYLVKNLTIIEQGLKLYENEGIIGIEFPIDNRWRIDILAIDKNNNFVVIELKLAKGEDKVLGQILRYKNWIKSELAEENQTVRGIIICNKITDNLLLACIGQEDLELFEYEYELSIKLHKKEY